MPSSMEHTNEAQPLGQVSTIKTFLQSCVKLLNDPSSVKVLQNMLERCKKYMEGNIYHKTINHLHTRGGEVESLDRMPTLEISTWGILYWI
jgi:hypothetical protein